MKLIISNLMVPIEKDSVETCLGFAAQILGLDCSQIELFKILNKIFIPRNKEQFFYEVSLVVTVPDDYLNPGKLPRYVEPTAPPIIKRELAEKPIIIGFGPAGMFAALELIARGIAPVIFERGKKIEERVVDIHNFIEKRILNEESNIQFGEGGAGSYSDGKLFSRKKNSIPVQKVLDTFVRFGAPEKIRYISKPHLGTDRLCKIVKNIRNFILESGGEIYFNSKLTDVIIADGKVEKIVINDNQELKASMLYLAIGHSARETFKMLHGKGVDLVQKPISVGVRLEHPAEIINLIRYGKKYQNFPGLEAATYSFNFTNRKIGRGVYTFCQCPGGEVLNASSQEGMLVVNGMSYSARSSAFSNAAIVVTCKTQDYGSGHPLAGIDFQEKIERSAFESGAAEWFVPAQNLIDFLDDKMSENLNANSCKMGTVPADMKKIFPEFVIDELKNAFNFWKKEEPLFVSQHGILLAAETRTTSPVRVVRKDNFAATNIENLFPIGEGAGYASGITSAATDAIKAVEASLG